MTRNKPLLLVIILSISFILFIKWNYFGSSNIPNESDELLEAENPIERKQLEPDFTNSKLSPEEIAELKEHIHLPSENDYNLNGIEKKTNPKYDYKGERALPEFVQTHLLKGMKRGFFIEAGAADGEYLSNTLNLEMNHQWTGLLVESNPTEFKTLLEKNRKAFATDLCLGNSLYPQTIQMTDAGVGSAKEFSKDDKHNVIDVRCFPIREILLAIGVTQIDYFSLDIEGQEMGVLNNFPWDEVQLKVLSIEVNKIDKKALEELMTSKGFKYIKGMKAWYMDDYIYAHSSIL